MESADFGKVPLHERTFRVRGEGRKIVVTSHLVGDFPGSPIDLRFIFTLEGGGIASLEILP